jgi:hypothetical protein
VLTVVPRGAFKNGFDLLDGSGRPVGGFTGSVWRENGDVEIGQERWEFRRERSRRFTLAGPRGTYATAERPSLWSYVWHVAVDDRLYLLERPSWLSRRYEVRVGDRLVGGLTPKGAFSAKAEVDLPAEMPPPVQVFVIAVVMTQWRRESSSAAATT